MKTYRLKKWYPSLDSCWEVEDIAYYYRNGVYWNDTRIVENGVSAKEVENNPDFWELIEEKDPLFVTDDGVELFTTSDLVLVVNSQFKTNMWSVGEYMKAEKSGRLKVFYRVENADKYIEEEKSKPLFITEDGVEYYKQDFAVGFNIHDQSIREHNDWRKEDLRNFKIFTHKTNADEYIWRNKRVFSYEDIIDNLYDFEDEIKFEQLAKGRAKK